MKEPDCRQAEINVDEMIKNFSRAIFCSSLAVYLLNQTGFGINYRSWSSLILAGLTLGILNTFLKPFLSLLALPINFLTFGFFSIFVDAGILYAVTRLVSGFIVTPFSLNEISLLGYRFPPLYLEGAAAFLIVSLALNLLTGIFKKFVYG